MAATDIDRSAVKQSIQYPEVPQYTKGAGHDEDHLIETIQQRKSIDYMMILASSGLGVITLILLLQGFQAGGFYLDTAVLTALIVSWSAAPAINALGRVIKTPS